MKKIFTIISLFCATQYSFAQTVPNAGFENWYTVGTHLEPNDWKLRSDASGNYSGIQTIDKNSGVYAINVRNILGATDTLTGVISTVKPSDSNEGAHPVFPVSARHNTLNYYYKYASVNNDSAQMVVVLFKTGYVGPFGPGVCGYGLKQHGTISTYTFGSINITYFDGTVVPDSAWIAITAYKATDPTTFSSLDPLGNSNLWVDDLGFDMMSGIEKESNNFSFSVMPNPTSDILLVKADFPENIYSVSLYDMQGKLVEKLLNEQNLSTNEQLSFNLSGINNGNYLLVIGSEKNHYAQKVIVQH